MIRLVGIFLAIISYVPSSLDAHILSERAEIPLTTHTPWPEVFGKNEELRVRDLEESVKKIDQGLDQETAIFDSSSEKSYRDKTDNEEYRRDDKVFKKLKEYNGKFEKTEYDRKNQVKTEAHLFNPAGFRERCDLTELRRRENLKFLEFASDNKDTSSGSLLAKSHSKAVHFSYIHTEEWIVDNPECSGRLQSPVNLNAEELIRLDVPNNLVWTGCWKSPKNMTISNTGHSVEVRGIWEDGSIPLITGGPLRGDYLFSQLHLHWGKQNSAGSEHTINNKSYPMEMHLVYHKKNYGTFNDALKYRDGLAVVAFLFEISETPNSGLNLLVDSLNGIRNKTGLAESIKPFPLSLLYPTFEGDYVSYIGSLTTPPCREIVTWLLYARSLPVSEEQLDSFRKISHEWPGEVNYRPKQALNGRDIYFVGN